MVLGDDVSTLETFVSILNRVSKFITWFLFALKSMKLGQRTNLNVIFHMVGSVYRLVTIRNSPQFPVEFRNGLFECSVVLPRVTRNRLYNFSSVTVVSKVVFVCSVSVSCCFFSLFFFCQYTSRLDILLVYFPHVKAVHCIDKPSKSLTALQLRSL